MVPGTSTRNGFRPIIAQRLELLDDCELLELEIELDDKELDEIELDDKELLELEILELDELDDGLSTHAIVFPPYAGCFLISATLTPALLRM